ncbi:hypothetical protein GWK47_019940 [Chionoecetes opilio]|uniref:Uncharacterized protein n=1 Tax=Chionoecetes opilio TaxID=41210 RepID=A0A8J4XYM6_CHIOP|nr:hypothetical protein GWK47_019940 [Chionoecetes opilio]
MASSPRPVRLAISFVDTFSTFQANIRAFSSVLRLVGAIWMCGYKSCSINKLTIQIRGSWYGSKHHRTPLKGSSVSTERETVTLQFPSYICLSCQIKVVSCWQHDLGAKPTYLWVLFATDLYGKRSILFADTNEAWRSRGAGGREGVDLNPFEYTFKGQTIYQCVAQGHSYHYMT